MVQKSPEISWLLIAHPLQWLLSYNFKLEPISPISVTHSVDKPYPPSNYTIQYTQVGIVNWVLALPSNVNPYTATAKLLTDTLRVSGVWGSWGTCILGFQFLLMLPLLSACPGFRVTYNSGRMYLDILYNVSPFANVRHRILPATSQVLVHSSAGSKISLK